MKTENPAARVDPLSYTGIVPSAYTLNGGTAAWVSTDISGSVPAAALVADIICQVSGATGTIGTRRGGSALARTILIVINNLVPLASEVVAQHVDMWDPATGSNNYFVVGYWS